MFTQISIYFAQLLFLQSSPAFQTFLLLIKTVFFVTVFFCLFVVDSCVKILCVPTQNSQNSCVSREPVEHLSSSTLSQSALSHRAGRSSSVTCRRNMQILLGCKISRNSCLIPTVLDEKEGQCLVSKSWS